MKMAALVLHTIVQGCGTDARIVSGLEEGGQNALPWGKNIFMHEFFLFISVQMGLARLSLNLMILPCGSMRMVLATKQRLPSRP